MRTSKDHYTSDDLLGVCRRLDEFSARVRAVAEEMKDAKVGEIEVSYVTALRDAFLTLDKFTSSAFQASLLAEGEESANGSK